MKLLKVGRSASCDIVLPSENVSSLHAEITIFDSGEIYIEDKNSTNGTKVGNKKITPNTEIPIRRGDLVLLADMELPWQKVPKAENLSNYRTVLNIGTSLKNDMVIEGDYCSRYHASFRISKNGKKAFIRDMNSKNGVKVNGVKIHSDKDVEIKKNDVVVCGDTDISEELKPHIPNPYWWVKNTAIACCCIAVLGIVLWCILKDSEDSKLVDLEKARSGVVYVDACYHYVVKFENSPIHNDIWNGTLDLAEKPLPGKQPYSLYSATAFYIDSAGRMATNRHVAVPWESKQSEIEKEKKDIQTWMETLMLGIPNVCVDDEGVKMLNRHELGRYVLLQAEKSGMFSAAGITSILKGLKKCSYTIYGELDYIRVGYSGRYYTHQDEFDRCFVLEVSDTDDKDIAILQMNTKKTPAEVQFIFDVNKFRTEELEPLKDDLYTIGFPRGLGWGLDPSIHSLEPTVRETKCSKMPGKYSFEFQGESKPGASGSPIFDKHGHLVGVLWGGWAAGVTYGKACQAKWLKSLYKKAIGEVE